MSTAGSRGSVHPVNTLDAITLRRSAKRLSEPAPSPQQLQTMLEAAVMAPDHHELKPWRFVILEGAAKTAFGQVMVDALRARRGDATPGQIEKEGRKLDRAPLVIVVATVHVESPLPFDELVNATAAAVQNLLLAATDLGIGSIWRSGDAIFDPAIKTALGFTADDSINGFIYLGTRTEAPEPHVVNLDGVVSRWSPA